MCVSHCLCGTDVFVPLGGAKSDVFKKKNKKKIKVFAPPLNVAAGGCVRVFGMGIRLHFHDRL